MPERIDVSFEIADAILQARYARNEVLHAEIAFERVKPYAHVDKRTRFGRAYKKAAKRLDVAYERQRKARICLADEIMMCNISSDTLLLVMEDVCLSEEHLERIGA